MALTAEIYVSLASWLVNKWTRTNYGWALQRFVIIPMLFMQDALSK